MWTFPGSKQMLAAIAPTVSSTLRRRSSSGYGGQSKERGGRCRLRQCRVCKFTYLQIIFFSSPFHLVYRLKAHDKKTIDAQNWRIVRMYKNNFRISRMSIGVLYYAMKFVHAWSKLMKMMEPAMGYAHQTRCDKQTWKATKGAIS